MKIYARGSVNGKRGELSRGNTPKYVQLESFQQSFFLQGRKIEFFWIIGNFEGRIGQLDFLSLFINFLISIQK